MWDKILKIKSFADARRMGKKYALKDYYESLLLPLQEYDRLNDKEKIAIHEKLRRILYEYGENDPWARNRRRFHQSMRARVYEGQNTAMVPNQIDEYSPKMGNRGVKSVNEQQRRTLTDFNHLTRTYSPQDAKKIGGSLPKGKRIKPYAVRRDISEQMKRREKRKTTSPMILDYFKMWKNMYNRLPTLTEITNSEGRPLTVDEERTFNEEYARRTQE